MGIFAAIILVLIAVGLFVAVRMKFISSDTLGVLANIGSFVAILAAILIFVVPAAQPNPQLTTPISESATRFIVNSTLSSPVPTIPPSTANIASSTPAAVFTETPTLSPTISPTLAPSFTPTPAPPTETPIYNAGQWVELSPGAFYTLMDTFNTNIGPCGPTSSTYTLTFVGRNKTGQSYIVRFDASAFHAADDVGNTYPLIGVGRMWCDDAGVIEEDLEQEIHVGIRGHAPLEAHYLIITADSINGVKLVFRKSLTGPTTSP